jgi:TPR repeat protein
MELEKKGNIVKPLIYLKEGVKKESSYAFLLYGLILFYVFFLQKDEEEVVFCFQKAVNIQYIEACFWLGFCYIEGKRIKKILLLGWDMIKQSLEFDHFLSDLYSSSYEPIRRSIKF